MKHSLGNDREPPKMDLASKYGALMDLEFKLIKVERSSDRLTIIYIFIPPLAHLNCLSNTISNLYSL